jgi:hypothetical protein
MSVTTIEGLTKRFGDVVAGGVKIDGCRTRHWTGRPAA